MSEGILSKGIMSGGDFNITYHLGMEYTNLYKPSHFPLGDRDLSKRARDVWRCLTKLTDVTIVIVMSAVAPSDGWACLIDRPMNIF